MAQRDMAQIEWWQHGIVYQIYPRSFQDSGGDGIGDLEGIRRRLDYLTWLGIDAVWVSPFYPSPMADFGYDVADYRDVDPIFGTLGDFDRLAEEVHERGLKLILDFVPNHTSDRHPWFQESRSSRDNPKRDWYIWCDPAPDGGPPNNWISNFGGSAWQYDDATGQDYYHAFLKEQADLNWRNLQVRETMYNVLRFWMDRGADGFRIDVLWHLMKDPEFRDNPPNPGWDPSQPEINRLLQKHSADHPDIHKVVAEMRAVVDEYPERVLIGEIYLPVERLVDYYGRDNKGAHLPFNFQLLSAAWNAKEIARIVKEYEAALPEHGWPNWVLGNHDKPRIASRIGRDEAPLAAMLLLTLRGTPTMYYADELALENVPIPPDRVKDPWELNEPGLGFGRDPERTPMPWNGKEENAGFTAGVPWLPLNRDWRERNVETLRADPDSILTLYRRLIALRRQEKALNSGDYVDARPEGDVFAFERRDGSRRLFVGLNFTHEKRTISLPEDAAGGRLLLSTRLDREGEKLSGSLNLRPAEGVVIEILAD